MINPLSIEECASVTELAGHDLNSLILKSQQKIILIYEALDYDEDLAKKDLIQSINLHTILGAVSSSINFLGNFKGKRESWETSEDDLKYALNTIAEIFEEDNLSCSVDLNYETVITNPDLIISAYVNLVKNSARICRGEQHELILSANMFKGRLENLVYQSNNTATDRNFVKFSVTDDGPGFDPEIPFSSYLEKKEVTQEGGFGLYYINLVCKYLGAHLSINSEPGNTEVSIFQPIK